MTAEIVEMAVKCRVPQHEAGEYVVKLRRGEERLPVPPGLICVEAFQCYERCVPVAALILAGYRGPYSRTE